ncbi:MAG: hypothetical protein IH851_08125 [Armatimonadetes bacterium]|nr:hypothetical protein [Armatimonadota bacterium]
MLPVLALLIGSSLTPAAPPDGEAQRPKPTIAVNPIEQWIEVKVLVLNFDPLIADEGGKRLHEVCEWNDPRELAKSYISDVLNGSGGFIRYKIVEWRDVNAYPVKADGFVYTEESYLACWRAGKGWHDPDGLDYPKMIEDYDVGRLRSNGEIDELWLFGAPYFGYWEAAMAGPGAFYINGGVYEDVQTSRAFAIMGFNYERGVAEMLHDLSHRTEATMSRIYGGWEADKLVHNWARFAANYEQSNGEAAVGSCHYPPNAESGYDYANERDVLSSAKDWLNYPNLTGFKTKVSRETWGGPDYHRNYMVWWFRHLPSAVGWNSDRRLNNWWRYVFDFNAYDERGREKRGPARTGSL